MKFHLSPLETTGAKNTTSDGTGAQERSRLVRVLATLSMVVWQAGCMGSHSLRGGRALTTGSGRGPFQQTLVQGDNPAQPSRQTQTTVKVRAYTLPAGARIEDAGCIAATGTTPLTNIHSVILNEPMPVTEREETQAASELGTAHKDSSREIGVRLSSLRGITWVGVGLFLFGLASLVWPPIKAIIGSVTTSVAILVGGVALMILPSLVAGNELLILTGVGLSAGAWFLAHRHGKLRGQIENRAVSADVVAPKTAPAASQPA